MPEARYAVHEHPDPSLATLIEPSTGRMAICSIESTPYHHWAMGFVLMHDEGDTTGEPWQGTSTSGVGESLAADFMVTARWPSACRLSDGREITITAELYASSAAPDDPRLGKQWPTKPTSHPPGRPGNRPYLIAELVKLSNTWMKKLNCGDQPLSPESVK